MKKSIKATILGLLIVPMVVLAMPTVTGATAASEQIKEGVGKVVTNDSCLFTNDTCSAGIVTNIINTALVVLGALAVIMLIYGGIRYTISAGDSKQVEAAKNTILYAIIGIVVALLAGAVVNFVLTSI